MSLLRFDRARSVESGSSAGGEVVPFDDESTAPSTVVAYEPWPNEPRSMEKLMDQHVVEAKFTGRTAGTSLILVNAASRDGKKINTVQDQEYKLFLVTSLSISLNVSHQGLNINLWNLKMWYHNGKLDLGCTSGAQVAHTGVEISAADYLIAHGPSKFVTGDFVDKLRRQKRVGRIKPMMCW